MSGQSVTSVAVSSGIRRLDPADGLFLRAEHLDQMQRYAAELSRTGALAGGPGTVYGYRLELSGSSLRASAGLAIDASGRPLRSLERIDVDLGDLDTTGPNRIWVVEVLATDPIASGNEPVYADLCATGCGPEASIRPWLDDAVQVRVRAQTLEGSWPNASPERVQNAMVSAYLEQERRAGGPWLTPSTVGSSGGAVPPLTGWPWWAALPAVEPTPSAVALGLLARIGGTWVLDVWSARRDRMAGAPENAWQGHLSQRPRAVFQAEVLQFQDQLTAETVTSPPEVPLTEYFVELPPAGFLPVPDAGLPEHGDLRRDELIAHYYFGDAVQVRLHECSADVALTAVTLAQHLDRIPLRAEGANERVQSVVDIWLPTIAADLDGLRTTRYGWMSFTRAPRLDEGRVRPRVQTQPVAVRVVTAPRTRDRYVTAAAAAAAEDPVAVLDFTAESWEVTHDETAERVVQAIHDGVDAGGAFTAVELLATSAAAAGEPLVAARARALAERLGLGGEEAAVAVFSARLDGPDAVFLMVRRRG